jgi:putative hydrolase of HD superfamily
MKHIANLLFEAKILKEIPRSGYHFLGSGKETVAEHSFMIVFIAYVMSRMEPGVDALKLVSMCLVHDLPESRTGDLNYVQKKYVHADEKKAVRDLIKDIPFGDTIRDLIEEFNEGKTKEASLARDADQLSFILELKTLLDTGRKGPEEWLPIVMDRLRTDTGKRIAESISGTNWDEWWKKNYVEG